MKTKKLLWLALALSVAFNACKKESTENNPVHPVDIHPPAKSGFVVVGYFPSYRTVSQLPDRMFRMCNVVNYAFANINSSFTSTIANTQRFDSLYRKAKANNVMVFLSIAGDPAQFTSMVSSSTGRKIFIVDVMQKVRTYKLDGIDIDWEYPRSTDGSGNNFTLLMRELSDSLHVGGKYFLTAAITPGKYAGSIRDGISNDLFQSVDWFNVMAYDDFSTDPSNQYQQHSPFSLAQVSGNYWLNSRGMPKGKFVLGIPTYGRPSGMTQTGTTLPYQTILFQGGSALSDSAFVTAGGYTDYKIYYNGLPTVKKKAVYANQAGGGIMFWEMGMDATDDRSLIKAACDTLGIPY